MVLKTFNYIFGVIFISQAYLVFYYEKRDFLTKTISDKIKVVDVHIRFLFLHEMYLLQLFDLNRLHGDTSQSSLNLCNLKQEPI